MGKRICLIALLIQMCIICSLKKVFQMYAFSIYFSGDVLHGLGIGMTIMRCSLILLLPLQLFTLMRGQKGKGVWKAGAIFLCIVSVVAAVNQWAYTKNVTHMMGYFPGEIVEIQPLQNYENKGETYQLCKIVCKDAEIDTYGYNVSGEEILENVPYSGVGIDEYYSGEKKITYITRLDRQEETDEDETNEAEKPHKRTSVLQI